MEIFKDIQGYPNYQISNQGRVWNSKTQRYIKASKKDNGYYALNLIAANGKRKKEYLHRLIALAFIDNPNNLPQVDHKDRNRENNSIENLRWVSASTNQRNTKHNRVIKQYDKNGNLLNTYGSIVEAVEAVNGSISGMYSYIYGKSKYYKGYIWK